MRAIDLLLAATRAADEAETARPESPEAVAEPDRACWPEPRGRRGCWPEPAHDRGCF